LLKEEEEEEEEEEEKTAEIDKASTTTKCVCLPSFQKPSLMFLPCFPTLEPLSSLEIVNLLESAYLYAVALESLKEIASMTQACNVSRTA
jgi:hypothetical protein